jgi:hypothetical protein
MVAIPAGDLGERRAAGSGRVELVEGVPGARGVEGRAGHEVGEDADAVPRFDDQTGSGAQPLDGVRPDARFGGIEVAQLGEGQDGLAGKGAGDDGRDRVADEDAHEPARAHGGADAGKAGGNVVDRLEDAVGKDEVEFGVADQVAERLDVTLQRMDGVRDAGLSGAATEGGEGVGADVDDGDLGAGDRERHGVGAAATAAVEQYGTASRSPDGIEGVEQQARDQTEPTGPRAVTPGVDLHARASLRSSDRRSRHRAARPARCRAKPSRT